MSAKLLAALSCVGCLAASPAMAESADAGMRLRLAYTAEVWSDVSGGLNRGGAFLDTADVQFGADLDREIGWAGASLFVHALTTSDNSIAQKTGALQGNSNIEAGIAAVRLMEAWVDQAFAGDHGSLRVGLYDLNTEFDAGEVRALFLMPSHGLGADLAQAGENGPSTFPVTSLSARLNLNFDNGMYVRAAILDGVPGDPAHPKRTTIDLSARDGALLIAEVGKSEETGRWSLGAWGFTATAPDLASATGRRHNRGAYAAIEQRLLSVEDCGFALAGSLRFGVANADTNQLSSYFGATLVATRLFPSRPDDQLGVALAIGSTGESYRRMIAADGASPAPAELNVELTYNAPLTDWLIVQPDVQWVVNPGADRRTDDALVVGVRLQLVQSFAFD